ncbi:hypothetical protein [Chitinophaga caseinilytica]|uniref:Lipoprotein n=1 Tax=Chitinophaga caseinilytica TaxID=2267521 RepID=A0ABZ2Z3T1_9BACT
MKPYVLLFPALAGLAACAGGGSEKAEAEAADAARLTAISEYVSSIDEKAASNKMMAAHNFVNGDNSAGVIGLYSIKDTPIRLYIFPEGPPGDSSIETWFYLDTVSVDVKMLREVITTKTGVIENTFYFDVDTLVGSESRKAKDLPSLETAAITPYESPFGKTDYRFSPVEVNTLAEKANAALLIDRKDLSPKANEMRRLGASHWAVGNEPGWFLAIIPNKKIIYTGNYGENVIEFPAASAQKGDKDASIFTSSANGHTLTAKFDNQVCTDDGDKKSPFTVTLTVDGKTFRGCGQSLF